VLPISVDALEIQEYNGWEALSIYAYAFGRGGDRMDGECSPSSSKFSIDEEHSPSLLFLLVPKAPLKMESANYPKSLPGHKKCSKYRKGSLAI
jgi:hypothetical protein